MDIWDWIRRAHGELRAEGHDRLSHLVRALPSAVCDNEHARVDAIVPEALALARAAEHPWLQVFVRHWNLQSRILHRHHVEEFMGEAVSLIEFANRPETRDCPQSVCVTQDLVNCYANADGPGWAEERIAASRETLARIDAYWPCYCCIGGELVDALVDAGRPEDALAELDRMEAALARTDEWEPDPMGDSRAAVLRALGRNAEALALIDRLMDDPEDEDSRVARQIERARILAELGRDDDALETLPRFETIDGTHSLYRGWVETVYRLALSGTLDNDWRIERRFRAIAAEMADIGVIRHAVEIGLRRVELALARERAEAAHRALETARALLPRLRAPLDAPTRIEAQAARIAAMPSASVEPDPDATPDALLASLGADPELDLERLGPALERWPADTRLAVAAASAWRALGELDRAEALLLGARTDEIVDPELEAELGRAAIERDDWQRLTGVGQRLSTLPDEAARARGRALLLHAARRSGDRAAELAVLQADVDAQPDDPAAAMRLADAQGEDDPAAALATLDAVIARDPEPGAWDWRRILWATRLDRWQAVRDSAARLGMRFPSESGPIDETWEPVRISVEAEDGELILWATRTGPVTARITSISAPEEPCHFADEVVFDPLPLDADEQAPFQTYRGVHVRRAGGHRAFVLDAAHPGEALLEPLTAAIEAMGGALRDMTGEYVVVDPDTDEESPGLYARVAIPAGREADLDALLTAHCADWPGPAVWTELLDALGEADRLDAQFEVMARWGM